MSRLVTLALRFNWASKAKFFLLALLIAVAMTVFLVVTELSRVSSEDLDAAIAQDMGETGTYMVTLSTSLGLTNEAFAQHIDAALAPFAVQPPLVLEVFPPITPECPPFEALGSKTIFVMRDIAGNPVDLPFGQGVPEEIEICLDGHVIPADAIYIPNQSEQNKWGWGIFVDSAYTRIVALSTRQPITYRISVVTGERGHQLGVIRSAVEKQLEEAALRYGIVEMHDAVTVHRMDSGDAVRAASDGIRLVYGIIGWGVLILGGLGLLVAEMIVVRDRTWFFGLARAVGARSRHIATLIFIDVLLVLVAGAALTVLFSLAVQPTANSFARNAFQVDVTILHPSALPQLFAGALLVLVLAGVYPALIATRQDPLDVLEPSSS